MPLFHFQAIRTCQPQALNALPQRATGMTTKHFFSSLTSAKIKRMTTHSMVEPVGKIGDLIYYQWECKLVQYFRKKFWEQLEKLHVHLTSDPAIPYTSNNIKIHMHRSFIATSVINVKHRKLPNCPHIEEWLNKLKYMYTFVSTVEYKQF